MKKSHIAIAVFLVVTLSSLMAMATSWYSDTKDGSVGHVVNSTAYDVTTSEKRTSGETRVLLSCQSTIVTLKAYVGPNTGLTNLTTVTVTARATTDYTTRNKYRVIYAVYSSPAAKLTHKQYMDAVTR